MEPYLRKTKRCKKQYVYNKCNKLCIHKNTTKKFVPLPAPPDILKHSYIRNSKRCKPKYNYNTCFNLCISKDIGNILEIIAKPEPKIKSKEPIIDSVDELYDIVQDIKQHKENMYTIKILYRIKSDYVIPFILTKNNDMVNLTIVNDMNEPCIEIQIHDEYIYLGDYYLHRHKHCPKIYHSDFFMFFKQLLSTFKVPGELVDASSKDSKCGNIPMIILSLKNGKSFYTRFGWKNDTFKEFITTIRKMTFEEAYFTSITNKPEKPPSMFKLSHEKITSYLKEHNLTHNTLAEISKHLVENCNADSGEDTFTIMNHLDTLFNRFNNFIPIFKME